MRKGVLTVWVVLLVAGLAGGAWADNGVDFGLRGGYQRFSDLDSGAGMIGLFLRVPWRSVILSEAAILYHREEVGSADIELIPIQLSAMLFFLRRDLDFSPYLLAGAGAYISRRIEADDDSETEYDWGWHLGFGLDYMVTDRIFVEGDFRYIWLDVDFEGQTVGEKLSNFDNWMATAAVGFRL